MITGHTFNLNLSWVLDLSSGQLKVSQSLEQLIGKPLGALEDLYDHLETSSAARLRLWLDEFEQEPEPGEVPLTFKDHQPAVYAAQIEPLFTHGELVSAQGRMTPILAILHEQPAANAHEPEDVCPQGCMGIVITDPLGRIRDCNPVFCQMLSRPKSALLGTKLMDYIHPADRERPVTLYNQLRDRNIETIHVEKRYQQADGTYFWAEVAIAIMREVDGEISHCVRFMLNLSERRQFEDTLAQNQSRLAELEQELTLLRQV